MTRNITFGVLLAALAGSGCSGGDSGEGTGGTGSGGSSSSGGSGGGCKLGVHGDPALPIEMKLVARDASGVANEIADGAQVSMILPPQGGRVIFVGALATNVNACGVKLSGALRDKTTSQVRVDERTTNLKPRGDGWGGPVDADISSFSNIPLCPNQWASTALYESAFELTVTLTDPDGRSASDTIDIHPICGEPEFEAECLCQCQKDYMLGEVCP